MEFLYLIVGLILGFVIAFLIFRNAKTAAIDTTNFISKINELDRQNAVLKTKLENADIQNDKITTNYKSEKELLLAEIEKLRTELHAANIRIERSLEAFNAQQEKYTSLKDELENVHKKYSTEFEVIANKILDEKTTKFTEQNKTNLDVILNPLKEKIKDFELKVEKAYKAESDERITLKAEIKNLVELNKQVSEEANNLAKALKGDNKMQGNWGEHILENIFERSGLIKDQEYKKQYSTTNENGARILPDFVVMLPDNKHIVVDSKVSLIAYEKAVNSSNVSDREQFLKEHLTSIRTHIKGLSEKNYQTINTLNSPDFVLMFIPIESSFSIAVQADNDLFSFAWDKKIVIVSPSTLFATLRTIASVWKQERQTKNAIEIAKQSGALYDKFVGFLEDMKKMGENVDTLQGNYNRAISKLSTGSGNLIKKAQDIEKLGAKATKQIPAKYLTDNEVDQKIE